MHPAWLNTAGAVPLLAHGDGGPGEDMSLHFLGSSSLHIVNGFSESCLSAGSAS